MASELERISISLESSLLRRMGTLMRRLRLTSRSEFLRDLIRQRLVENEWEQVREVVATITLVYNHHEHDLSARLTDLQHEHHDHILATTHVHLDRHLCAEVIILRGRSDKLTAFAELLRQQKGVLNAALAMSSTGAALA